MTDIKQIYTSHQSLVGTVTPSFIWTVPLSLGGYAPSGQWYSPYNFGDYNSSNQRQVLACIFVYYQMMCCPLSRRCRCPVNALLAEIWHHSDFRIFSSLSITCNIFCFYPRWQHDDLNDSLIYWTRWLSPGIAKWVLVYSYSISINLGTVPWDFRTV